mgnify:CR=1 FL=1
MDLSFYKIGDQIETKKDPKSVSSELSELLEPIRSVTLAI